MGRMVHVSRGLRDLFIALAAGTGVARFLDLAKRMEEAEAEARLRRPEDRIREDCMQRLTRQRRAESMRISSSSTARGVT